MTSARAASVGLMPARLSPTGIAESYSSYQRTYLPTNISVKTPVSQVKMSYLFENEVEVNRGTCDLRLTRKEIRVFRITPDTKSAF